VNTVEYILRPVGFGAFGGLDFVDFELIAERRGELLGGKHVQATIRSPDVSIPGVPVADAIVCLPSSRWLAIPSNQFAEQPSIAQSILESAAADLEVLIDWATARAPDRWEASFWAQRAFAEEFFAVSIRAVGPDYWR
jgi:hypothetical protein